MLNKPEHNRLITPQELAELEQSAKTEIAKSATSNKSTTFIAVLKMPILWKLSLIWFLFDITFWGFTTWLPSYLLEVRQLSLAKTGIWAAVPFLFGALGTLTGGYIADKLKKQLKIIYCLMAIFSGLFLFFMFHVNDIEAAIILQCISAFFMFIAFAIFLGNANAPYSPGNYGPSFKYC